MPGRGMGVCDMPNIKVIDERNDLILHLIFHLNNGTILLTNRFEVSMMQLSPVSKILR